MPHLRIRRPGYAVAGTALLALALAACDGEPLDAGPGATPPASPDPSGPPDPGAAPPPGPGQVTDPGTELAVGLTAVVPLGDGLVAVTVTAVEEGDQATYQADFNNVEDTTAYYAWVTVEHVSGDDFPSGSVPTVRGILDGGRSTRVVLIGATSGDCQRGRLRDFGPGSAVESCNVVATHQGDQLAGVQWREGEYRDDPISWLR